MKQVGPEELRRFVVIFFALVALVVLAGIGCFWVWRYQLSTKVEAQLGAIRAAGLPVTPAELNAWYTNVPDEQNAAKQVEAAIAMLGKLPRQKSQDLRRLKLPRFGSSLTSNQLELLREYIDLNRNAMNHGRSAVRLPLSRYSVDLNDGYNTKMPYLQGVKSLAQLEQYVALLEPGEAGTNVVACVEDQLGLARTLDAEPVLLSQLVRVSCLRLAVGTIERALNSGEVHRSSLEKLRADLNNSSGSGFIARGLIGERAMYIPAFRMGFDDIARLGDDSEAESAPLRPPARRSAVVRLSGFFERDLNFYLGTMATNIAYAKEPPPQSLGDRDFLEDLYPKMRKHFYIVSAMLIPGQSRAIEREVAALAYIHEANAALNVELYRQTNGALPETLRAAGANFVDPFNGNPLRYLRRPERGYIIYSVGPDGKDDGGKEQPEKFSSSASGGYDLTFVVDR